LQLAEMKIQSYKELVVWQKSMFLCEKIYTLTETFPKSELFSFTSQMRRAALSIPSNIAEGKYRGSRKDFVQFLRIARGSAAELETQLSLTQNLKLAKYQETAEIENLIEEISKMLSSMIHKLQATS
jgi:four helix bundle protein